MTTQQIIYAIPSAKKLPLHDKEHVKMAANAITSVKGITEAQRAEGRANIIEAEKRFGLPSKVKNKLHMHFESMALIFPATPDHPNKMHFTGVMTRLDVQSDFPVGGTNGKKVIIPVAVAEKALHTLLGMAVDYTPNFDGHDRTAKIGLITEAFIGAEDLVLGTPLHIAGFFYAADFPSEVIEIQANKELLGFSYEAEASVESMSSDPWVCASCDFTGAAVLYKDKAAFTATSLQASKGATMTPEEIAALQAQNAELKAQALKAQADATALQAQIDEQAKIQASSVHAVVKPHADAIRACAASMAAAGIGADAAYGHATIMNKMADHLESQAFLGKIPSSFDSYYYGNAEAIAEAVKQAVDAAKTVVPVEAAATPEAIAAKEAADKLALEAAAKVVTDSKRKSLSASALASLKKIGIDEAAATLSVATVDKACRDAGMTTQNSIALKLNLRASGALAS
jgi:hypothetical protein